MSQHRIKCIAFDLDGTLVDSMGGFTEIASHVIEKYFGVNQHEAVLAYKRTSGLPFRFQLESLFPGHPNIAVAEKEYEDTKVLSYATRPFFDDVAPALKRLHNAGVRLAVSSNNHEDNVSTKVSPLKEVLHDVLGYHPGFLKGRDHFEWLVKQHALNQDEMLFVGDSLHDARMAHENRIPFVARVGTFDESDFLNLKIPFRPIRDLNDLCQLLETAEEPLCN